MRNGPRACIASLLLCLLSLFVTNASAQLGRGRDPLTVWSQSRIASEIRGDQFSTLSGNRHPQARTANEVGTVSGSTALQSILLVLAPSDEQQSALEQLLSEQHDPNSPYYHQWLTPEEFGAHYGVSEEDVARVRLWLEQQGFSVDEVAPSRRSIRFSGSAAAVERAFQTSLRRYRVNGETHLANASNPQIPVELAGVVGGIASLHDFRAKGSLRVMQPASQITYGSSTHYVTPADLATIYDANTLYNQGITGSGQSVAVVARSNIKLSDVAAFRAAYGLPAAAPQVIVTNSDPGTASGDFTEATLDVEYAGALAKNATVKFVTSSSTATSDGVFLSAQYIINQNLAPVMTISYGECEQWLGSSGNAYINALWQQAAAQGITVLVSSGDSGAAGCDSSSASAASYGKAINGLCSSPYSVCVGGTQFNDTSNPSLYWSSTNSASGSSALSYIPEKVWNESGSTLYSGGGGVSTVYTKPSWQTGLGVPADGKRDVPDLSLTASVHDGYMIVANGAQGVVGGTSASAPTLAGVFALLAQSTGARQGAPHAVLYRLATQQNAGGTAVFHDITSGNNSVPGLTGFSATAGFDLASGLGSVDVAALVNHWNGASSVPTPTLQLTSSSSSASVAPGGSQTLALTVSGGNGFKSAVTLTAIGLPTGITASLTPALLASPGSGTSALRITVGSTVASGTYSFNVTASGGGLSSSVHVMLTVAAPSFTLSASSASLTLSPGGHSALTFTSTGNASFNSAVTLAASGLPTGVTAVWSPTAIAAPGSGSSTLTLTAAATVAGGSYAVTVKATAGTLSKTVQFTLTVPSLSLSLGATSVGILQGGAATAIATTKVVGGFSAPVTVSVSGLPSGITMSPSSSTLVSPGSGSVTFAIAAAKTAAAVNSNVTITASGGGITKTVLLTLSVKAVASFSLASSSQTALRIKAGSSGTVQVLTVRQNGFASTLTLTASGAPSGTSLTFAPTAVVPGYATILTVRSSTTTPTGSTTLTVRATGGGLTQTLGIPIVIY